MKKYLLIILSLFIVYFSFAQEKGNADNSFSSELQKDSTQINLLDLQKLKLYPNPVSDILHVDYDVVFVKEAKLIIHNSIGVTVFSKEFEEKQDQIEIQVSDFKNGLYFCSLQIDGKLLNTKKILVNH
ncbi:MAG: T9SS type A sorting domain-containing protein [Bacteroidota bacterium]|nr:T9SS type A sorting domain-containing protein [Bacteroidota bacterium]